jgi:hypothetical protein
VPKPALAALAPMLVVAFAAHAYTPGGGISGTPHDWSGLGETTLLLWIDATGKATTYNTGTPWIDPATGRQGTTGVTIGQCTTCHTPHQAGSGELQWNYTLRAVTYKWNDPATTAGTRYPAFRGDTYKGPTTKCLSCHDGLLAPIDGWFDRAMTSRNAFVAAAGTGHEVSDGADLSRTHPVAMPYPINGVPNTYNFVRNGAQIDATEWVADPMVTNGVRLFADDGAGNVTVGVAAGRTGIECSSCHDVHNGSRAKERLLLTGLLSGTDRSAGGYLCAQCHRK